MADTQSTDACMGKPHRCGWKVWGGIVSLGLCIYFKSKIYKLPSAVGCSRLDYLPRENMAVKNSCVCVLHCIRLTPRSLAGWKNRVRTTQRWGQLSQSREVASDIASPHPFAPRAQQKSDSSDWTDTHIHFLHGRWEKWACDSGMVYVFHISHCDLLRIRLMWLSMNMLHCKQVAL